MDKARWSEPDMYSSVVLVRIRENTLSHTALVTCHARNLSLRACEKPCSALLYYTLVDMLTLHFRRMSTFAVWDNTIAVGSSRGDVYFLTFGPG